MGLITDHDGAADGYEAVQLPPDPVITAGLNAAMLRRRSARPSRRAVLYLRCGSDSFVPEDLASWYTERGFHFYLADLRPKGRPDRPGSAKPKGKALRACFSGLDSACAYLRTSDGIDAVIVGAHGAGAMVAALWCHERRESAPADALVLSSPTFGRRLRRGLDIACPVLVISVAGDPDDQPGPAGKGSRGKQDGGAVRLGPHVTWLRIDDGIARQASAGDDRVAGKGPAGDDRQAGAATAGDDRQAGEGPAGDDWQPGEGPAGDDRRRFFDEMGRWLGAYMYGQVRDQLL